MHYLPLAPIYFSVLVGLFVLLLLLIQIGVLRYAYTQLGISSGAALTLLCGSLIGSYINIPITELPGQQVLSGRYIDFFGMRYAVPYVVQWPGTVLAVNVGGAVIPSVMSVYLLLKHEIWLNGAIAIGIVAIACNWMAEPIPGLGIAMPVFIPALVTGITALILSGEHTAQLAYVGGSLGTLIGADLLNLGKIGDLGAPIASIGGAGTFDGIFLIGILAVLLASFTKPTRPATS